MVYIRSWSKVQPADISKSRPAVGGKDEYSNQKCSRSQATPPPPGSQTCIGSTAEKHSPQPTPPTETMVPSPCGGNAALVTVRVCVSVFMCSCIHACSHNLLQAISYFNTNECSSYTQKEREQSLSLNASSCSNGTTLDYNCQEWQLE